MSEQYFSMSNLIKYNKIAVGVHLASCIGQLVFITSSKADWKIPVTVERFKDLTEEQINEIREAGKNAEENMAPGDNSDTFWDNEERREKFRDIRENIRKEKLLFEIPLGWSQLIFSLVCVLAHLYLLSLKKDTYRRWMGDKINYMRWFEYFLSSAVMMTNIAGLSGIRNLWMLLSIFGLTAVTNIFGLLSEIGNSQNQTIKYFYFFLGFVPFIIPWIYIISRFDSFSSWYEDNVVNKIRKGDDAGGIPPFVNIVIWSLFGSYMIFPLIQILQITGAIQYRSGEAGFLFASIISKTLLTWAVFSGAFREDNNEYLKKSKEEDYKADTGTVGTIIGLCVLYLIAVVLFLIEFR